MGEYCEKRSGSIWRGIEKIKVKGSDRMPGFLGEISKNKTYKNFGISDRDDSMNACESGLFCIQIHALSPIEM